MLNDKDYLNFFIHNKIFSRFILRKLKILFGTWEKVYNNLNSNVLNQIGISNSKYFVFIEFKKKISLENLKKEYKKRNIRFCMIGDNKYPQLLKEIHDYPLLLYYQGDFSNFSKKIAIIGSRKPTSYGQKITCEIAIQLQKDGVSVVSGLALGIDSIAHLAVVNEGGQTIAILPSSLDQIYPRRHYYLAQKIIDNGGCLFSEYPLDSKIELYCFPERNRIIAGISDAVVITEASKKSGTRITADYALNYGRDVFAVPGDIKSELSYGTNHLIKEGANVYTQIDDLYSILNWSKNLKILEKNQIELSYKEKVVFDLLDKGAITFNCLLENSGLLANDILQILTKLELKNCIRKVGGKYVRA